MPVTAGADATVYARLLLTCVRVYVAQKPYKYRCICSSSERLCFYVIYEIPIISRIIYLLIKCSQTLSFTFIRSSFFKFFSKLSKLEVPKWLCTVHHFYCRIIKAFKFVKKPIATVELLLSLNRRFGFIQAPTEPNLSFRLKKAPVLGFFIKCNSYTPSKNMISQSVQNFGTPYCTWFWIKIAIMKKNE